MPPPFFGMLFLPAGLSQGFVSVTLGFVLGQRDTPVIVIAGLIGLRMLPASWSFLVAPVIDVSLTPARWYFLSVVGLVACFVGFGYFPLEHADSALFGALCFASGVASALNDSAACASIPLMTTEAVRGACAGWRQGGYLGGMGLGGGGALWLTSHAGGLRVAALATAGVCLLCLLPFGVVKVPRVPRSITVLGSGRVAIGALWKLVRTRAGILAVIAVTMPAGLGAAAFLLPAVAGDWHASADLVAIVTGALSGMVSIPGCIGSGYLCDRFPRRTVYLYCALAAALIEALMAMAPHTPAGFVAMALTNALFTGLAYGSVGALIFEQLSILGAATIGSVFFSLCFLPVVVVSMVIGTVQARAGSTAMLLTEAALGVGSVALYALFVAMWRAPSVLEPQPDGSNFDVLRRGEGLTAES